MRFFSLLLVAVGLSTIGGCAEISVCNQTDAPVHIYLEGQSEAPSNLVPPSGCLYIEHFELSGFFTGEVPFDLVASANGQELGTGSYSVPVDQLTTVYWHGPGIGFSLAP
jgi:hypothetical protein